MKNIKYSKDIDALLIEFSDKPITHAEDEGQIIIHFSKGNEPVLLEIFDASKFISQVYDFMINKQEIPTLIKAHKSNL